MTSEAQTSKENAVVASIALTSTFWIVVFAIVTGISSCQYFNNGVLAVKLNQYDATKLPDGRWEVYKVNPTKELER